MKRYCHAIFCEDVRQETGGKISLMGIYHGWLLVQSFPFTLPKLCVVLTAGTPLTQPFQELVFEGRIGDRTLFDIKANKDDIAGTDELNIVVPGTEATTAAVQAVVNLAPITFDKPGRLSVTLTADGEVLECIGLVIGDMTSMSESQIKSLTQ